MRGITSNGTPFNNGGFDNSGWAFAEELLGRTITWQGVTFPIGPPNTYDVVTSEQIPLPAGRFATLLLLGDLVNGEQPPTAHFVVTYTDGSTAAFDQSLSDWVIPRNYPGESLVDCMPSRHLLDGSMDLNSVCVYGYQFALDPSRTVASITLPQDRNVLALAMALIPPAAPGSLAFMPAKGTVLPSGTHPLSIAFTPANPAAFQPVSASQNVTVYPPVAARRARHHLAYAQAHRAGHATLLSSVECVCIYPSGGRAGVACALLPGQCALC